MVDVIESVIVCVAIYFIIRLVRTTGKYAPDLKDHRLENAHRLLLELEAVDKVYNILPLDLKRDLEVYMEKSRELKSPNWKPPIWKGHIG